jgi:hypothetical protein
MSRELSDDDVDAIAERVAEKLAAPERWLTAEQAAELLGVGVDYVYEHQAALGVRRLGDGKRARLRFRPDLLTAGIEQMNTRAAAPATRRRGRPRKTERRTEVLGGLRARPV